MSSGTDSETDFGVDSGTSDLSLSEEDVRLYRKIYGESDEISAGDPRLGNLRSMGVVFTEPLTEKPSARPLRRVERALYLRELDEIDRRVQRLRQIAPVLDALEPAAGQEGTGVETRAVQILTGARAINTVIHNAIEDSGVVWSSQPNSRSTKGMEISARRDIAILRRGRSRYRNIYPTSARMRTPETNYARQTAETGYSESRTSSRRYPRMIITDTIALISDVRIGEGSKEPAIIVRDHALLAWLREEYERYWEAADPWFPDPSDGPSDRELVERTIFQMLSEGHTREFVCRELDISPRTYSNYMAGLRDRFGAKTNERLMFILGRRGGL